MKSPLFHFFAVAGLIFITQQWLLSNSEETSLVSFSAAELDALHAQVSSKEPPSRPYLKASLSSFVDQSLLFHEGLQLGLVQYDLIIVNRLLKNMKFLEAEEGEIGEDDVLVKGAGQIEQAVEMGMLENDPVIRRRVIQVAEMYIKSQQLSVKPTDQQLQTYVQAHAQHYQLPAQSSFQQVFFKKNYDPEGEDLKWSVVLQQLERGSIDAESAGDATMLPHQLKRADQRNIAKYFGSDFARQVESFDLNKWQGPVKSQYGFHLVKVTEKRPAGLPPIKQIERRVSIAWQREQKEKHFLEYMQNLRKRYFVQAEGHGRITASDFPDYWLEQWL